ncbi:phosphotransferase [Curtobacterium oceanosedimentum]|uniref:phosphotransferase n=1 Tax=Curtobacterium oceanosedimentum TaxID=465820 RepID=UPI0009E95AA3|nr:phosphotransferase [Curtobacterium oceanosedimentum]
MTDKDEMDRGRFSKPERVGDEVHRLPMGDNTAVHELLRVLPERGFVLAPRYLGQSDQGRERLSYISGTTGYPPFSAEIRSERTLVNVARAIRSFHDASAGLLNELPSTWNGYEFARPAHFDCIGHYDLAPWNMVFDGEDVVGIIDWDAAGPSSRVWDLAYAAFQFIPFHATSDLVAWGWDEEPDRRARLRLFLDSYGGDISASELVDTAVLRVYGIGSYLDQQARAGNPAFAVQAKEDHAGGFRRAAQFIAEIREDLL